MPANYVIDNQHGLVISTGSGVLTFAEALAHQNSLASDPRFRSEFNQLLDFTAVTDLEISTEQLRTLATRNFFAPTVRRAMLVNSTAMYGVGRMLTTFRELRGGKEEIAIFQDRNKALAWLLRVPVQSSS